MVYEFLVGYFQKSSQLTRFRNLKISAISQEQWGQSGRLFVCRDKLKECKSLSDCRILEPTIYQVSQVRIKE